MFDLPLESSISHSIAAEIPAPDEDWTIGAIVGPSGSGKSTLAREVFGEAILRDDPWPENQAIIDCMGDHPIKRIVRTLTSVGFSSPKAWLKPYDVLSTGEKFRGDLARGILRAQESAVTPCFGRICVFDEYSSVVDRTVARISSAAVAKAIRSATIPIRFVAITCHYDVLRWLQPDWILDMSGPSLSRGRVREPHRRRVRRERPPIPLRIVRADRSTWDLFKPHHYLSVTLHHSAICFLGTIDNRPAAFTAVLAFPHPQRPGWREHRTVCLPDFQGVGIGTAMSDFVASLFVATGKPYFSTTSHPAMIHHRMNSPLWRTTRKPGMCSRSGMRSADTSGMARTNSRGRNTASFEYVGPPRIEAAKILKVLDKS